MNTNLMTAGPQTFLPPTTRGYFDVSSRVSATSTEVITSLGRDLFEFSGSVTNTISYLFQSLQAISSFRQVATNPVPYAPSIGRQFIVRQIVSHYDSLEIDLGKLFCNTALDDIYLDAINWIPVIIKNAFGDVKVALKALDQSESSDPMWEIHIMDELELDDKFDQSEKSLFAMLDGFSLSDSLDKIIITYA